MNKSHGISGVFVFLLLGVFAVFGTVLVLLSAEAYRDTVVAASEHNTQRILESVCRNMIRSSDRLNGVFTEEDGAVLCTSDGDEEETYITGLYVFENRLMQYVFEKEEGLRKEYGEVLCNAKSLHAELDGQRLTVCLTDKNGTEHILIMALRAAGNML